MDENNNASVKYPENRELRKQLKKGEMVEIAKLSCKDVSYVRNIMGGYSNNDEVIAWAKRIIADRNKRIEQIINPTQNKPSVDGDK